MTYKKARLALLSAIAVVALTSGAHAQNAELEAAVQKAAVEAGTASPATTQQAAPQGSVYNRYQPADGAAAMAKPVSSGIFNRGGPINLHSSYTGNWQLDQAQIQAERDAAASMGAAQKPDYSAAAHNRQLQAARPVAVTQSSASEPGSPFPSWFGETVKIPAPQPKAEKTSSGGGMRKLTKDGRPAE